MEKIRQRLAGDAAFFSPLGRSGSRQESASKESSSASANVTEITSDSDGSFNDSRSNVKPAKKGNARRVPDSEEEEEDGGDESRSSGSESGSGSESEVEEVPTSKVPGKAKPLEQIQNRGPPTFPQPHLSGASTPRIPKIARPPATPATPVHIPSHRDLFDPTSAKSSQAKYRLPPPNLGSKYDSSCNVNDYEWRTNPSSKPSASQTTSYNHDSGSSSVPTWESFEQGTPLYDPKMSQVEAEKALRDLCDSGVAQPDHEVVEIDMELAKVKGFRDGIELLPHQILGRTWMKEREAGKSRGGILADDMGLGKTIQTITRIVEGRPRKADKDEWDPPTLVVCPLALVSQWAAEIDKMAVGLKVIEHHGPKRETDPKYLRNAYVIVTTYQILVQEHAAYEASGAKNEGNSDSDSDSEEAEHFGRSLAKTKSKASAKGKKKPAKDALFRVKWWRIVLDEAHNIKNRNTKAAQACFALRGKFRWCLTGTPMQNSVDELYSLLRFLEIRPLNNWDEFNTKVSSLVKRGRPGLAMKRLHAVLKTVMLRRKKDSILNGEPILKLPQRIVEVVSCDFDAQERAFYQQVETKIGEAMEDIQRKGELKSSYTQILVLLLRLRQACDHAALINKDYQKDRDALEPKAAKKDDEDDDELADLFGKMGMTGAPKCKLCQTDLSPKNMSNDDSEHCAGCAPIAKRARRQSTGLSKLPESSAKIRKILEILRDIDERSDGQEKTIIFSQFTSMLDIIEPFLKAESISFVRYDGTMSKDKRDTSLNTIKNNKSTKVILISFKAGSTGLNLTVCNNVILTDLWWNPALEDQAFDRTHRLGQTKDVRIHKLMIEDTVEARILELQTKKRLLTEAALSGEKMKNLKLGFEELINLFAHNDVDGYGDEDSTSD